MDACNVANVWIVYLAIMQLLMSSRYAYVAIFAIIFHVLHLLVYFKKYHFEIFNQRKQASSRYWLCLFSRIIFS